MNELKMTEMNSTEKCPSRLNPSHHRLSLTSFLGMHKEGSIHPQSVESQTRDLSEKQFTVICQRVLTWCINIVPNMPIHHQAAGGFWLCSDQICTQRWWGACWFCYRKVQIQLFVTSSFNTGRQRRKDTPHRNRRNRTAVHFWKTKMDAPDFKPCKQFSWYLNYETDCN